MPAAGDDLLRRPMIDVQPAGMELSMTLVAFLFRATVLLWGVAIVTAIMGHLLDQEWLTGLSFGVRRFAPAVTLVWLLTAFARMIWLRFWPIRRPKR